MEFDDGEMVVIRHEYDEVYTSRGETRTERQSDAFYAIREPASYDLTDTNPHLWTSSAYKIPGDIHIYDENDLAGYRKLLDAIEVRLNERKAGKDA